jgi:CRISPR/Cas system-associated protein endoribonuclease Cas2
MGRLDEYRIMWAFVFFDLPTDSIKHRRNYARFPLEEPEASQFSIYVRQGGGRLHHVCTVQHLRAALQQPYENAEVAVAHQRSTCA